MSIGNGGGFKALALFFILFPPVPGVAKGLARGLFWYGLGLGLEREDRRSKRLERVLLSVVASRSLFSPDEGPGKY